MAGAAEQVRRWYAELNRAMASGEGLDTLAEEVYAPDIVLELGALEGTFHGREGARRFHEGQMALFDELQVHLEEVLEAADDRVVATWRLIGRSRSTGIPIDQRYLHVWTLRDGRATHIRLYEDRARALRAAGLKD